MIRADDVNKVYPPCSLACNLFALGIGNPLLMKYWTPRNAVTQAQGSSLSLMCGLCHSTWEQYIMRIMHTGPFKNVVM